jgi:hypothetical protein
VVAGSTRSPEAFAGLAIASILLVLATPIAVDGALLAQHAASYSGTCGPYAPDIPAYACGWSEYLSNFFGGFELIGLVLITIVTVAFALALVAAAWVAGLLVWLVVRRAPSAAPREP